jgi:ParB-like chromosome segregation protein Spo0J
MLDLQEIPLTAITPSPFQIRIRKNFDSVTLRELADSLARDGQAQAILVRPVEDEFTKKR